MLLALPCRNCSTVPSTDFSCSDQKRLGFYNSVSHFPQLHLSPVSFDLPLSPSVSIVVSLGKLTNLHLGRIEACSNIWHFEIWLICLSKNIKETSTQVPGEFHSIHPSGTVQLLDTRHFQTPPPSQCYRSIWVRRWLQKTATGDYEPLKHHFLRSPPHPPQLLFQPVSSPYCLLSYPILQLPHKRTARHIIWYYYALKCHGCTKERKIFSASKKWKLPKVKGCFTLTFISLRPNTIRLLYKCRHQLTAFD